MITIEAAIKKAEDELARCIYLSECVNNLGLQKIHSIKAEWLSVVVYLAKKGLEVEKGDKQ